MRACDGCWAAEPAGSHLCDFGVGTLAVGPGVLQPLVFGVEAVLLEGAAALGLAPDAAEQGVGLQAQAAALPPGVALVQVHCGHRATQVSEGRWAYLDLEYRGQQGSADENT